MKIPGEYRDAWRIIQHRKVEDDLDAYYVDHFVADGLKWAVAEALRLEFEKEHETYTAQGPSEHGDAINGFQACAECGTKNWNIRHLWTEAQWAEEAEQRLREP